MATVLLPKPGRTAVTFHEPDTIEVDFNPKV